MKAEVSLQMKFVRSSEAKPLNLVIKTSIGEYSTTDAGNVAFYPASMAERHDFVCDAV